MPTKLSRKSSKIEYNNLYDETIRNTILEEKYSSFAIEKELRSWSWDLKGLYNKSSLRIYEGLPILSYSTRHMVLSDLSDNIKRYGVSLQYLKHNCNIYQQEIL